MGMDGTAGPGEDPGAPAPDTRRRRLADRRAEARRRRTLVGVTIAAGAAAALAIAMIVVPGAAGTPAAAPSPSTVIGTPASSGGNPVLLDAAAHAEREKKGRYRQVEGVRGVVYLTRHGYLVEKREEFVTWSSAEQRWTGTRFLGARPLRPRDEKAWRQTGKPSSWEVDADGGTVTLSSKKRPWAHDGPREPAVHVGRAVLTPDELDDLPTDPAKLETFLLDPKIQGEVLTGQKADGRLFDAAATLLTEAPASPKLRAALYRVLADIASVRTTEEVTDPLGRTGTAVGVTRTAPDMGAYEDRLIIDEATGTLLARVAASIVPPAQKDWAVGGVPQHYQAYRTARWTDGPLPDFA